MAGKGSLARALGLRRGEGAADAGDPVRELRRAVARAGRRKGDPKAVQIAGQPLGRADYARWRKEKLGQGAIFPAPEVERGRYALVLLAIDLESSVEFTHHDAGGLVTQPTVGTFELDVRPALALSRMLADWLDRYPGPVALAPPLLHVDGRWRVADIQLDWTLQPNEP